MLTCIITRHVTVVMQLANPRHPRPVHISRYCPLSRSNITRYGPDFDSEYNKKKGWKKCWWPSRTCNKCVIDRTRGQYRTRYMPSRLRRSSMYWTVLPGCLVNNTYVSIYNVGSPLRMFAYLRLSLFSRPKIDKIDEIHETFHCLHSCFTFLSSEFSEKQ